MEHQPRCLFAAGWQQATIQIATEDGVAQQLAVDAQLMGAASLRHQPYPGEWHGLPLHLLR